MKMEYGYKVIGAADGAAILSMDDAQLALMAAITGERICRGGAPLVGNYARIGSRRIAEREPVCADLEIAYEWIEEGAEAGRLCHIYVGSAIHGPLMGWAEDGWRNCYGHGNHGRNGSHGGTWASSAEVRSLLTEKDPRLKDAREIFIAASHGDKKATKQFAEIALKMKAEGKTAAEILEQVAG